MRKVQIRRYNVYDIDSNIKIRCPICSRDAFDEPCDTKCAWFWRDEYAGCRSAMCSAVKYPIGEIVDK